MLALLFLFVSTIQLCNAHRYLFVSLNVGYSHLEFDGRLADILVERGHEVDFIVHKVNTFVEGNGSRLANIFQYTPKSIDKLNQIAMTIPFYEDVFQYDIDLFTGQGLQALRSLTTLACYDLLGDFAFIESLRARKYDGAFAEMLDACSLHLFHKLGIKNVMITSPTALSEIVHEFGLPALPSFVPNLNKAPLSPLKMNFPERLINFLHTFCSNYITAPLLHENFDQSGKLRNSVISLDAPTIMELRCLTAAFFVNTNDALDLPRPTTSLIHHIGGIAIREPKELDKETSRIFEIARKGVVLLSFGSIVDTTKMNVQARDAFLQTFSQFKDYEFIWKYVGSVEHQTSVFQNYSNVHPFKWLDQTAILNHPKTKTFISHVGLNSLNEAAYFGVPLLAIPFFGDQTYNAAIVKHLEIGVPLSKRQINVQTLTSALNQLLNEDSKFEKRSKTMSQMLRNQLNSPADKFVHEVEFATQFSDELKRQRIPYLNSFAYFSLDVISFLSMISFLSLMCLYYAFKKTFLYTMNVNMKQKCL